LIAAGVIGLRFIPGDLGATQQQDPLAEPFKGVTTNGTIVPGLFAIRKTGVSTEPVMRAAEKFLAALTPEQKTKTAYPVDDSEWRKWNNVHRAVRQGVNFREMSEGQRTVAWEFLKAALSAKGLEQSRNIMRLNGYVAEVLNNSAEYGDDLYHLTVMGAPSKTEPWGWQLEGHHLTINYFVLGDQVVMTPTFMGSEPVTVSEGKYAGTAVLQAEQNKGLAFYQSLTEAQRRAASIASEKTANHAQSQAFRDNVVIANAGMRADLLTEPQRKAFLDLIGEFISNMPAGQAKVRMSEISAKLSDTYFAWAGGADSAAVFYYRIQSPVVLIEFDHQTPVAFRGTAGRAPTRQHIHTVVRTPNGNDYGKDLLRLHYEQHKHGGGHH
jgi:hypothetical protein